MSANMISGLLNGATVYFRVKMLLKEKRTGAFGIRKTERSLVTFSGRMDVRAQAEDLGNDHVMVNTQGIENLKYLCEHPDVWNVTDKTSLRVLQGRYEAVLEHYKQWVQHVLSHLGGKRLAEPDDENIYIPEKPITIRRL